MLCELSRKSRPVDIAHSQFLETGLSTSMTPMRSRGPMTEAVNSTVAIEVASET